MAVAEDRRDPALLVPVPNGRREIDRTIPAVRLRLIVSKQWTDEADDLTPGRGLHFRPGQIGSQKTTS